MKQLNQFGYRFGIVDGVFGVIYLFNYSSHSTQSILLSCHVVELNWIDELSWGFSSYDLIRLVLIKICLFDWHVFKYTRQLWFSQFESILLTLKTVLKCNFTKQVIINLQIVQQIVHQPLPTLSIQKVWYTLNMHRNTVQLQSRSVASNELFL